MSVHLFLALWLALASFLAACPAADSDPDGRSDTEAFPDAASDAEVSGPASDTSDAPDAPAYPDTHLLTVLVTLDGQPLPAATVVQGGTQLRWLTESDGTQLVEVDLTVVGEVGLVATHPQARTKGAEVYRTNLPSSVTIGLTRFAADDNTEYVFQDPGEPDASPTTQQCGHCHVTINRAWFDSPHRTSASNPRLQDLYSGRALNAVKPNVCGTLGGEWVEGLVPGTAETGVGCYTGPGVLPALNPGCQPGTDCETNSQTFGGCADCHAPGIDGHLGGRNLLEARGRAHDYGVHCDICHKVESVDLTAPAGVAGRLRIHRPSEPASISLGGILPIQFGPNPDVPNIRMGNVPREHFHTADLCAGCHELQQPGLIAPLDLARWPGGRLPVHTTYSEWKASGFNPAAPCQSCHMPPDPSVSNGADLQLFPDASVGTVGGWHRPPGAVRQHSWIGPNTEGSKMLENAAALAVDVTFDGEAWLVSATTKNVGPGHAIPTGEPMRSIVLVVEASCEGVALAPVGGAAISQVGGALAVRDAGQDWALWEGAQIGDRVRITAWGDGYYDYIGFGSFGDGTFDTQSKGWRQELVVGESEIIALDGGIATFAPPLPPGDRAYLVRGPTDYAGLPGADFARVLVGLDGDIMVPHFAATDVSRDNRLLPQHAWTSEHRFESACLPGTPPTVRATLYHLDVPATLARRKGWQRRARIMTEVVR